MRRNSAAGVGIGLFLWGVIFIAFAKYIGLVDLSMWIFNGVGFVLLLVGSMGTCVELFGGSRQ
jgi:hypothetical protein